MNKTAHVLICALLLLVACDEEKDLHSDLVELDVLMPADTTGIWHRLSEEFHSEHPRIRVRFVEGPSATNTREDLYVTSFLSGDSPYDLVYADIPWVPKFAAAGWIVDLTDRWPEEAWNRFIDASVDGSTYRDRIFSVPMTIDAGMLYYRKDLLAAAGEAPPRTFDELVDTALRLQDPPELWGFVWQGKQYEGLVCDYLEVLHGYGGFWIDAESRRIGLGSPAADALDFLRKTIHEWEISPPGTTTYAEEESRQLFQSGRALFHRNWPYVWTLAQQEGSPIRGKVGFVPMPRTARGEHAAALGGWGFSIATQSPHAEEAWTFIDWMSRLSRTKRLHNSYGVSPALKEFYLESEDPAIRSFYEIYRSAVPRPPIPQYAQASDILQRHVSSALTGRAGTEQALAGAREETRLLLGEDESNHGAER